MTHPVGQKSANPWGLKDIHGNVWEWIWDWYGPYPIEDQTDYTGVSSGVQRVLRGGGWGDCGMHVRSAFRWQASVSGNRSLVMGFRLVRSVD